MAIQSDAIAHEKGIFRKSLALYLNKKNIQ